MTKSIFVLIGILSGLAVISAVGLGFCSGKLVESKRQADQSEHIGAALTAFGIEAVQLEARIAALKAKRSDKPVALESLRFVAGEYSVSSSGAPTDVGIGPCVTASCFGDFEYETHKLVRVDPKHGGSKIDWNRVDTVTFHTEAWNAFGLERFGVSTYADGVPLTQRFEGLEEPIQESLSLSLNYVGEKIRTLIDRRQNAPPTIHDFEVVSVTYQSNGGN